MNWIMNRDYQISRSRKYLAVECLVMFFLAPALLYFIRRHIAFIVVPLVLVPAGVCALMLIRDRGFDSKRLYSTQNLSTHLKRVLLFFALPALGLGLFTYLYFPSLFLDFPLSKTHLLIMLFFIYPVLAAYPQEIIFRGFFFQRYRDVFPGQGLMIFMSGLSFSLAHIFYGNWLAPLLSFAGGILFGYRYVKSGSVLVAGVEHGLWGNYLFTVGLGWFFYSGSIG